MTKYLTNNLDIKKWAILGLFFVYFRLFKQTLQFLQIYVKKCYDHLSYGARIWTHDLRTTSRLQLQLDQGSRPII